MTRERAISCMRRSATKRPSPVCAFTLMFESYGAASGVRARCTVHVGGEVIIGALVHNWQEIEDVPIATPTGVPS